MYLGSATTPAHVGTLILPSSSSPSRLMINPTNTPGVASELQPIVVDRSLEWLLAMFQDLWLLILRVVEAVVSWVDRVGASLPMRIFEALCAAYFFVETHPHPFHILGWSIFFGPIIILIPGLLVIELLVLVAFQLSSLSHGVSFNSKSRIPTATGPLPDRLDVLREYFMEWRENLFANVEHWTAVFNKWTVDFPPLLVLRLAAGAMSLFILFGLWSEVPT